MSDDASPTHHFSLISVPEPIKSVAMSLKEDVEDHRKNDIEVAKKYPLSAEAEIEEIKDGVVTMKSKTPFHPWRFNGGVYILIHDINVRFTLSSSALCFVISVTPFTLTAQVVKNSWRLQVLRDPIVTVRSNVHHAYYNTQLEAIDFVASQRFIYEKLILLEPLPSEITTFPAFRGCESKEPPTVILKKCSPVFTEQQLKVIDALIRQSTTTFAVSAVPGTGKTTVLVEAAIRLIRAGGRVLFATAQPWAADIIAQTFVDRGLTDKNVIFRALGNNRDTADIGEESLSFSERIKFPPVLDISGCSIVITTFMLMYKVSVINNKKSFTHIFIDDAENVCEMSVWTALYHFGHENVRLVLCGNPYIAFFNVLDEDDNPEPTPMHRAAANKEYNRNPNLMLTLTEGHRSHKAIVDILARLCYEDKLKGIDLDKHNGLCNWEHLPNPGFPVLFHNVDGEVKRGVNRAEAQIITDYINSLKNNVDDGDIKLYATPWQKAVIQSNFGSSGNYVSRLFASSQPRVTLVSTVRNKNYENNDDYSPENSDDEDEDDNTNEDGSSDSDNVPEEDCHYMFYPMYLNSVLSQTKELVVVVGHAETLERSNPAWKQFIDYCRDNNSYIACANNATDA